MFTAGVSQRAPAAVQHGVRGGVLGGAAGAVPGHPGVQVVITIKLITDCSQTRICYFGQVRDPVPAAVQVGEAGGVLAGDGGGVQPAEGVCGRAGQST